MGNYGADIVVNKLQAGVIAGLYNFIPTPSTKFDQWTLDSTNRVLSFHDGTNHVRIHFKINPQELPLKGEDE